MPDQPASGSIQPLPDPIVRQPRSAEEAMAKARQRIARTADARAGGWEALAALVSEPDEVLIDGLRDGTVALMLREATEWLGADSSMVLAPLMSLETHARGAGRRSHGDDLARLRQDHADLLADGPDLAGPMRELAGLCHREAQAWSRGDDEDGKALRARQRERVDSVLGQTLPPVATSLAQDGMASLTRSVGRMLLGFLSAETGRDYLRAALGDPRSRSRR